MNGGKAETYMVLEPVNQEGSRFFVPVGNPAAMAKVRPVLTPTQLEQILEEASAQMGGWIADESQRKLRYRELIAAGDPAALAGMVRALYLHRADCGVRGKKVHLCDDNFLRDAEKVLISEISAVMDVSFEEARDMLRAKLKQE
jgi:CarD family transcriptional regulator